MTRDKLGDLFPIIEKKINEYILNGIKEETRNILAFYKERGYDLSDLPTDILKEDILLGLPSILKLYALRRRDLVNAVVVEIYIAVLQGSDTLDITDPNHQNVQKYIKRILKK